MIRTVILDWAGTMVDYGSFAPVEAFRRLFAEHGIAVSSEVIRKPMGRMKIDHLRDICEDPGVSAAWQERYGRLPNVQDVLTMYEAFEPMLFSLLDQFAVPVPGAVAMADRLHAKGITIGTTTGYTRAMLDVIVPEAAKHGYKPDSVIAPDETAAGRPYPWMIFRNAEALGTIQMKDIVKCGDTEADMREGRNAGVWAVGVVFGGNELGLTEEEVRKLPEGEKQKRFDVIAERLKKAGAHYIISEIGELDRIIEDINLRMVKGELPC
ncbi:phosphonoacetaldehyde hydrolase [Paenibacillus shunpengii]|uniref:Phosphonoacetaldehyde hydrolase n=1 Tax=Paenibacillus shunpengii TaxID=2054424 RepID=A0ABW5SIG6_9BACL|nr:phosphonoacetaldehyde hydrolase [Paenibacillus sp. PDC88]SDX45259.1 phosphonoacetaldehyde hydrolase [Paenibacillus sp. PDC88]